MSEAVQEVLQRIEQLPEEDRLVLEERLAEWAEAEWKREAESARQVARERGLDQAAIDQAIEELRDPKRSSSLTGVWSLDERHRCDLGQDIGTKSCARGLGRIPPGGWSAGHRLVQ